MPPPDTNPFDITKEQWVAAFNKLYPRNENPRLNPPHQLTEEVDVQPAFDNEEGGGAWISTWTWVSIDEVED